MSLYIYKYGHRSAYALFFESYFKLTANSKMYTEELMGISSILKTTNQNNYSDSAVDRGCISLLVQCLEQNTLFWLKVVLETNINIVRVRIQNKNA